MRPPGLRILFPRPGPGRPAPAVRRGAPRQPPARSRTPSASTGHPRAVSRALEGGGGSLRPDPVDGQKWVPRAVTKMDLLAGIQLNAEGFASSPDKKALHRGLFSVAGEGLEPSTSWKLRPVSSVGKRLSADR